MNKKIGVIGAGNMAEALIQGVLQAELISANDIIACDLAIERREVFSSWGCQVTENINDLVNCDILLLAVKPQVIFSVLPLIADRLISSQLLISIAAGITIVSLQEVAPEVRIVRVMPNTPMLVGSGVSGVAKGNSATDADVEFVLELCRSAGVSYEVTEGELDAVTGLSGSGPAYVFYFAEALTAAGVAAGLSHELAEKMAEETILGAAKLLTLSNDSAVELRKKVTSPNGTTEAALKVMQDRGLADIVSDAVVRAKDRSIELSQGK